MMTNIKFKQNFYIFILFTQLLYFPISYDHCHLYSECKYEQIRFKDLNFQTQLNFVSQFIIQNIKKGESKKQERNYFLNLQYQIFGLQIKMSICNQQQGYSLPCGIYQGVSWCCKQNQKCCVQMGMFPARMLCCSANAYGQQTKCCVSKDYETSSCCTYDEDCNSGFCSSKPSPKPDSTSNNLPLILGITIPIGIILIGIIVYLKMKKRKKESLLSSYKQ